jgi:cytochrome c553
MVKINIYTSLITSVVIQVITGIIQFITIFINVPRKLLFLKGAAPACAICHTLEAAGAAGAVGPSMNELQPDAARVLNALKNGIGQMPAYTSLTPEQMKILSEYVAKASRE